MDQYWPVQHSVVASPAKWEAVSAAGGHRRWRCRWSRRQPPPGCFAHAPSFCFHRRTRLDPVASPVEWEAVSVAGGHRRVASPVEQEAATARVLRPHLKLPLPDHSLALCSDCNALAKFVKDKGKRENELAVQQAPEAALGPGPSAPLQVRSHLRPRN
ncbi:hypothetical protein E2562_028746 [Oryza meyeriana var. granulata]|uniref:Uncharacterized protein n=1 Tax=Oryza meyeriana var. granulata TaxID=110450 RepID=A0A6G1D7Y8_9ORYZ|nr:hypothetical protein E2562_028746 [Oryza meyeriana var. granulata]